MPTTTYIPRKLLFDLLDNLGRDEVSSESEESLLKLIASEVLQFPTVELDETESKE